MWLTGAGVFAAEKATAAADPLVRLQRRLDRGEVELTFDARWGYLPSLLEALKIPTSSQVLVFFKDQRAVSANLADRAAGDLFQRRSVRWMGAGRAVC